MPADLDYITLINPVFTDVAFHILISFILALIINVRIKHRCWFILAASIGINGFIDADHFITCFGDVDIFHNMFVLVVIPLAIYAFAFLYGQKKKNGLFPGIALIICVIFISHLYLDVAAGTPIHLQYPLSTTKFIINPELMKNASFGVLRTQEIVILLLFFLALAFNRIAAYHIHTYTQKEKRGTKSISVGTIRKVLDRRMAQIVYLLTVRVLAPHKITAITWIPLAEVYRRLSVLVNLGIVEVKSKIHRRKKKVPFFGVVPVKEVYVGKMDNFFQLSKPLLPITAYVTSLLVLSMTPLAKSILCFIGTTALG